MMHAEISKKLKLKQPVKSLLFQKLVKSVRRCVQQYTSSYPIAFIHNIYVLNMAKIFGNYHLPPIYL